MGATVFKFFFLIDVTERKKEGEREEHRFVVPSS